MTRLQKFRHKYLKCPKQKGGYRCGGLKNECGLDNKKGKK